jgi:hypothetical protein
VARYHGLVSSKVKKKDDDHEKEPKGGNKMQEKEVKEDGEEKDEVQKSILDYRLPTVDVPVVFGGLACLVTRRVDDGKPLIELLVI